MPETATIRIQGLHKSFESTGGAVHAVRGIDLEIREREFLVLLGPSGCGKTTTLRCIAGLERPDSGSIEIGGELVDSRAEGCFVPPERRDIGMVFQSYAVWPHLNVFNNVALPLTHGRRGVSREEVRSRVLESLSLVRLEGFGMRPVTDLSGGQQQRVALARAIVTRPRVLLMDEPLSNLDARLRDIMRADLKRLTTRLGVTTVYVTHDQIEALSLGDRICVMESGRILQKGPPEEIYARPSTVFVAQFVGDMNLLPGTVTESGTVETPIGPLTCGRRSDFPSGTQVTLGMRPEEVEVANGAIGGNVVEGKVATRLFVGDAAVWSIEIGSVTLNVKVRGKVATQPGEAVKLRLPVSSWHVWAESAQMSAQPAEALVASV